TENWNRPAREVQALMGILRHSLRKEREELRRNNVRLQIIGRRQVLPASVVGTLDETLDYLSGCSGLLLNLALSYSGRSEIVDALRRLLRDQERERFSPERVKEELFGTYLYT